MTGPTLGFVMMACAGAGLCQNAQLSGLVRDPAESAIVGAEITLRNELTGGRRTTWSNGSGLYSIPSLSPSPYRITIRAPGFATVVRDGIKLDVGDNVRLDFTMRIGDARTVITVKDTSALMNAEDGSVGMVIDRKLIEQMPLNGRGLQSLIELSPGVTLVPVSPSTLGQFAVDGQRQDANSFTIDGVSANFAAVTLSTPGGSDVYGRNSGQLGAGNVPALGPLGTFSNLVSPDALQEFRIQTSTFAPEFGRNPGAQVGLVTRSGSNQYAASMAHYLRNESTDANDWFRNATTLPKPAQRFRDSSVSVGGPLVVPRLYTGLDRTFFFFSFEDAKLKQAKRTLSTMTPTREARVGASRLFALLLNALPLPNQGVGLKEAPPGWDWFSSNQYLHNSQRTYGLRMDHYVGDRLTSFVRYNWAPSVVHDLPYFDNPANSQTFTINTGMITFGLTHLPKANLVNEIRWNASVQTTREDAGIDEFSGAQAPPDWLLFPPEYSSKDSAALLREGTYQASKRQSLTLYYGLQSRTRARQLHWVDNLSYANGKHQFKVGVDYRWYSPVNAAPRLAVSGVLNTFSGIWNSENDLMPSFGYSRTSGDTVCSFHNFSAYAQDTWRPGGRVSITYGVRWDVNPAPRIRSGVPNWLAQLANLSDFSQIAALQPGEPLYTTKYSAIGPRVGVAWQLVDAGSRKTMLRLGAGLFFDSGQVGFAYFQQQPRVIDVYRNIPLGTLPTWSEQASMTSTLRLAAGPGYTMPQIYQWNITFEQALGPHNASAAYIGSRGRRLSGSSAQQIRPAAAEDGWLQIVGSAFSSSYDSLQLRYSRRVTSRLQSLMSYTWSHSIDNQSYGMRPTLATSFLLPDLNRGSSDFDIRHALNGALLVSPPAPHGRLAAAIFRNWTLSGIFFARSAPPTDVAADGWSPPYRRPDLIPDVPIYLHGREYPGGKRLNPGAFSKPAEGVLQGTLGRNVVRMFGAWQIDLALQRQLSLTERAKLQFRVDAFNVLNHPNFASPGFHQLYPQVDYLKYGYFGLSQQTLGKDLGASEVLGQLNSAFQVGQPRSLQFAVRLNL